MDDHLLADDHAVLELLDRIDPELRRNLPRWRGLIETELRNRGATTDQIAKAHKLGDGKLIGLIIKYGPEIMAIVTALIKLLSIVLPVVTGS